MHLSPSWIRHPYFAPVILGRHCTLVLCLLLFSGSTQAQQVTVHRVVIGVIQDLNAPVSPSQTSPPPLAPPVTDLPPKVVDIHGQPVSFDTGHADMAHRVIVDSFGGGDSGENKARLAQQAAENLTANYKSLTARYSQAWDGTGSSLEAIYPETDTDINSSTMGPSAPAFSTQFFTTSASVATPQRQTAIMDRFNGHIPGGVVLEGSFDPGTLNSLIYDARYHALDLDMPSGARVVYLGVPAQDVSTLCHAIAGDNATRVAVSLVRPPRTYGALKRDSNVALNMFVGDHFLGAIAFGSLVAPTDLLADFRLPGGYTLEKPSGDFNPAAVMFTFTTDAYKDDGKTLQPSNNALDVLFVPLEKSNGNYVAAMSTDVPQEFLDNARHITDQLDYYREEPIIALMFRYAQTATLLRGLKDENVDLDQLARSIAFATGESK